MRYTLFALITLITFTLRAQSSGESIVHTIQPGETLSSIALRYKISVNELQRLNPKTYKYVYAGMKLTLPAEPEEEKAEPLQRRIQDAIGDAGKVEVITAQEAQQILPEPRHETTAAEPAEIVASDMVLCYQTVTQANPTTLKRAVGRLIEGQNKLTVWMRGDDLHLADSILHIHTVLLPDQNLVYIYSDLTKMGVKVDLDYYTALNMSGLAPAEKAGGFETRNYQLNPNGMERKVLDQTCHGYQGRIITTQQLTQVEIWQNRQLPVTLTMNYVLDGIVLEGLPMSYSIERRGMTGYALNAGDIKAQLTRMERREVTDEELLPEASIRFTTSNDPAELASFYSDNLAVLKRLGLYPADNGNK